MKLAPTLAALPVIVGLALVCAATRATAHPCVEFQVLGTDLDLNYNPFSPQPVNRPFELRITRQDPSVTSVRFILIDGTPSQGRSRVGPAGPTDYDITWLHETGQPVFFFGSQSVNPAIGATASFGGGAAGNVVSMPFLLHIPAGRPVAASRQYENVEVRYQCSAGASAEPQQVQYDNRVSIHLSIPHYFGAYIGSPGRSHGEVDFGTLSRDGGVNERHVAVTAVSTVPYVVDVKTDRGSTLRRSATADDGIPYTMKFADIPVSDNSSLRCPMTQSSLGDTADLDVKLNANHVHDLPAGSYRDTITLTFTPLDGVQHGASCQLLR